MKAIKRHLNTANINIGISLLIIALTLFSMSFTSGSLSRGIKFSNLSFKDAHHQAKYRKKPLFVFIGSHTCMQSKRMEEIFKNKDVSLFYNKGFYCNKFETESLGNFVKASMKWGVKYYPTFLFFDEEGNLLMKEEGYKNYKQTLEMAEKAMAMVKAKNNPEEIAPNEVKAKVEPVELSSDATAPLQDISKVE